MLTHFSISQQGERHIEKNVPCQDFSASKRINVNRLGGEVVIAAVSDGVGSCEYSQFGSATAVQSFVNCVEYNIQHKSVELSSENIIRLIKHSFNYALFQVEKEAEERELPFLEFDSTLTGVVYDGHTLYYGHIGDDGIVVLYSDGKYEMITQRHKGEEANSLFPLRETDLWQFGMSSKEIAACILMTDGILDYCVDTEIMGNRVYFPFLEPALIGSAFSDEDMEKQRLDWDEYLAGKGDYPQRFRDKVTDDISFVVIRNPDLIEAVPSIQFDFNKWDENTAKRKRELDDALYADYRAYKAGVYQSKMKRAIGWHSRMQATDTAVFNENKSSYNRGKCKKNYDISPEHANLEDVVCTEKTDAIDDDICAEAVEEIENVFKTAHNMGRFVRKQCVSKRKKYIQNQEKCNTNESE